MICKYCREEIVDEGESYIVRPKLEDARDLSSEVIFEYAHLDCYIKGVLSFMSVPIEGKLKWWAENP